MTRQNRVTSYETKQFLCQAFSIVKYNPFIAKDLEKKIGFDTKRISYILQKASYYGYCKNIGTKEYPFMYNGKIIYRHVNEYQINKFKYK